MISASSCFVCSIEGCFWDMVEPVEVTQSWTTVIRGRQRCNNVWKGHKLTQPMAVNDGCNVEEILQPTPHSHEWCRLLLRKGLSYRLHYHLLKSVHNCHWWSHPQQRSSSDSKWMHLFKTFAAFRAAFRLASYVHTLYTIHKQRRFSARNQTTHVFPRPLYSKKGGRDPWTTAHGTLLLVAHRSPYAILNHHLLLTES